MTPRRYLAPALLLVVALDGLAAGLGLLALPGGWLRWLGADPTPDAVLLARGLGALVLAQAPLLVLAAVRPAGLRGLAAPAALGRAIQAGLWLWLWLLGADRVRLNQEPLGLLLAHDLLCLGGVVAVWALRGR